MWWISLRTPSCMRRLDACQVLLWRGAVQRFDAMTRPSPKRNPTPRAVAGTANATRSSPRSASCWARKSFADLSVSMISERAGVARSGFYFYFDSKYEVLAFIVKDARSPNCDVLTHNFAPRDPRNRRPRSPSGWSAARPPSSPPSDPIMAACTVAQATDTQIASHHERLRGPGDRQDRRRSSRTRYRKGTGRSPMTSRRWCGC